jgi:predicted lysophospholipase L1 biosynthesis ABC-type transport system permease subunit
MLWVQRLWLRLRNLFLRQQIGEHLDDEIQFHLEQQIAENIAAGTTHEQARFAAQRAEIGMRVTLGAKRLGVLNMVLRETVVLVGAGVGIGLPCAFGATRLIGHMLYGVSPNDPVTVACVVGALLAVGVLGGYLPARRAMRVDPMVALRYE